VETAVNRKSDEMAREGVADMAAVVIDNASGAVVAYVGNSSPSRERPGVSVDIASSPRSTGSILKPFLYAAALQDGVILPETLLPDIPVNLGGFAPQNFDRQFYGAVHASEALARSLNVPAVFLLRSYGVPRFHELLQRCGLTTLGKDASYYGLSLILGGGEGRLDEITRAYSGLVRTYVTPGLTGGLTPITDKTALWYTFEALKEVNRPDELDWRLISSVRKAAWKTGTSYGFRDAWAVGMTPDYTIGVWAGNAEGQGVPGLTGARAAGPVMFDILNLLPESGRWFPEPEDGMWVQVCPESGMLAGPDCPNPQDKLIPSAGLESEPCPYHTDGVFTLTPAMEWYYKPHHPEYTGASVARSTALLEFIYPSSGTTLYLPRQLDGKVDGAVFRLAHRKADATVFWHLDQTYVGETRFIHEMRLAPAPGKHVVTCVDAEGNSVSVGFTVAE
jgi:penicillin-binding protein 1C